MTLENLVVRVEGIAAAEAAFPNEAELKKILGKASAAGAKVYRAAVKDKAASAFKDTDTKRHPAGTLRGTIRFRRVRKLGGIAAEAGPLGKHQLKTTPLAHLVDSGHDLYKGAKNKGGHKIGHVAAHPFVAPAFAAAEDAATAAAEAVISAAIDAL